MKFELSAELERQADMAADAWLDAPANVVDESWTWEDAENEVEYIIFYTDKNTGKKRMCLEYGEEDAYERAESLKKRSYYTDVHYRPSTPEDFELDDEPDDEPDNEPEQEKYDVVMSSGWSTRPFISDLTLAEAYDVCEQNNWVWLDENEFEWSLDIV